MPEDFNTLTVKLNKERIVPTHRFNLAAGAPSKVLRTVAAAERKRVAQGMIMVAHPVLRSVPLATAEEAQEALPVVDGPGTDGPGTGEEEAGPLYGDRHEENVRWYLPAYKLVKPGELETPLLLVREAGVDEEGATVFAGTLTFSFVKKKPQAVRQALAQAQEELPDLEAREIPLAPKEVELRLAYLDGDEEKTATFTAPYDAEQNRAQFELRGSALQLAYALLAQREGAGVTVIGDFNSWVPAEEDEEQMAAAEEQMPSVEEQMDDKGAQEEAVLQEQLQARRATEQAVTRVRVRDPRNGKSDRARRARRKRAKVRDHRQRDEKKKRPRVRDHRQRTEEKKRPKVRDLRKRPKVRDHRQRDEKKKPPRVRDHRDRAGTDGEAFRFEVEGVAIVKGRGVLAIGRLTEGAIRPDTPALIRSAQGKERRTTVTAVSRAKKQVRRVRAPARNVGLLLPGISREQVNRGDLLLPPDKAGEETAPESGMVRQRQIVGQEGTAHVPCGQFRQQYRLENGQDGQGQRRVFGCEPPWGGDFAQGARYRELGRDELDLPADLRRRVRIYESLGEVAVFLLVPESYVLARTTDTFTPALSMTTVLDAEEVLESKVVFDFVVAPNLLPFHLWQIRATLSDYLQAQMGVERRPDVRFPTSLSTPPAAEWRGPFTRLAVLIADGDSYVLTVEANSVAEAQAVVKRIKGEQQALNGSLAFKLDETLQPTSSLIVDLNRTAHPGLAVGLDEASGFVQVSNRCESPAVVERLLFYREDPLQVRVQPLPEAQRLAPDEDLSVLVPEGGYNGVAADYDVVEDTSVSLSELRVDVGMLEVGLGVDTDLQPHERFEVTEAGEPLALESIRVLIEAPGVGEESMRLEPGPDDSAFATGVVSLLVPLDRYLDPDSRLLRYLATFAFADGTELRSDWEEHDYGKNPNLTVRRQVLRALLED